MLHSATLRPSAGKIQISALLEIKSWFSAVCGKKKRQILSKSQDKRKTEWKSTSWCKESSPRQVQVIWMYVGLTSCGWKSTSCRWKSTLCKWKSTSHQLHVDENQLHGAKNQVHVKSQWFECILDLIYQNYFRGVSELAAMKLWNS